MRRLIRDTYFRLHAGTAAGLEAVWLQEYFRLLVAFNGVCLQIDKQEALSAIGFRKNINERVRLYTRVNDSSDLEVVRQIWEYEEYAVVSGLLHENQPAIGPMRIIDAGANVGYTTLYLKNAFPAAHIVSVEPETSNFRQLTRNLALNNYQNVTPVQAGLWKREAHLEVARDFRDQREWSFYVQEVPKASGLRGFSVRDLLQQQQWDAVDLLKIDIEGAERYLFEDADLAKQVLQQARFVAIEIHDEFEVRPRIYEFLRQNDFDFFENGELTIGRNRHLVG